MIEFIKKIKYTIFLVLLMPFFTFAQITLPGCMDCGSGGYFGYTSVANLMPRMLIFAIIMFLCLELLGLFLDYLYKKIRKDEKIKYLCAKVFGPIVFSSIVFFISFITFIFNLNPIFYGEYSLVEALFDALIPLLICIFFGILIYKCIKEKIFSIRKLVIYSCLAYLPLLVLIYLYIYIINKFFGPNF